MVIEVPGSGGALSVLVIDESRTKASSQVAERALLVVYGVPSAPKVTGVDVDLFLQEHAKRLSSASNALVAVLLPSGVGTSKGTFSPLRWKQDMLEVVSYLTESVGVATVFLVGFEMITPQTLAAAAEAPKVGGVVTISTVPSVPPYSLNSYEISDQLESFGVVVPSAVETIKGWENEYLAIDPSKTAPRLGQLPWLVIHGADDRAVPVEELRRLLDDVDGIGELHILNAGGESLRADPRVLALLVGWLARIVP